MAMNKEVKMIRHQAPGENVATWLDVFMHFFEEEKIVIVGEEDCLFIIPSIVDVIK